MPYKDPAKRREYRLDYQRRKRSDPEFRAKERERGRRWHSENRDWVAIIQRRSKLKRNYGITQERWSEIFSAQGDRCAICKTTEPRDRWALDHDHNTGRVRGILCVNCNLMLGHAQDDSDRLVAGAKYLEGK